MLYSELNKICDKGILRYPPPSKQIAAMPCEMTTLNCPMDHMDEVVNTTG